MEKIKAILLAAACLFMAGLNLWNEFKDWFDKKYERKNSPRYKAPAYDHNKPVLDERVIPDIVGKSKTDFKLMREQQKEREERQKAEQARKLAEKALKNQFKLGDGDNSLEYNLDPDMPNTLVASNIYIRQALKVIGEALIAGFYFSDQIIRSKAKTGTDDAMVLDGLNGSLQFNNYVDRWSESGGMETKKQYIKIDSSSDDARVEARNVTDGDVAYLSSQGIFANRAGINALPATSGVDMKAAIAGLGFGKMDKSMWGSEWGIVGVYGTASNSSANPAPAYGGYFNVLQANGLFISAKRITTDTTLTKTDVFVSCYNSNDITVTLPKDPYIGQYIQIRKMNDVGVYISGNGKNLHGNGNLGGGTPAKGVNGDVTFLIWDGQYWCLNWSGR